MNGTQSAAQAARQANRNRLGEYTDMNLSDGVGESDVDLTDPDIETEPFVRTYDIYADNLAEAKKRIARVNRRLEANGFSERFEPTFEPYTAQVKKDDGSFTEVSRVKITMNRPRIAYEGWEFMARVEQLDSGDFIAYSAPGQELEGFRPTSMECDHCGKTRARTKVYVVKDADGQLSTIGGSCVELYTGVKPGSLDVLGWDDIADLEDADSDWERSPRGERVMVSDDVLKLAWVLTKDAGYQNAYSDRPTRGEVERALSPSGKVRGEVEWAQQVRAEAEDLDADEIRRQALEALEGSDSDWAMNVRATLRTEYVNGRALGTLVSSMAAIHKAAEKKRQRDSWQSGFLGQAGDKLTGVKAKVVSVHYDEEAYGYGLPRTVAKITMQDEHGRKVFWKSYGSAEPKPGDEILLSGTVKDTSTFQGVDSTRITRAKFEVVQSEGDQDAEG